MYRSDYIRVATDYSCQILHTPLPQGAVYGRKGNTFFYITDFEQFCHKQNFIDIRAYTASQEELRLHTFQAPRWYRKTVRASFRAKDGTPVASKFYKEIVEFVLDNINLSTHTTENILRLNKNKSVLPAEMPKSPCARYDAKHMPPAEAASNEHTFVSRSGKTLVLIGKEWEDALEVDYEGERYRLSAVQNILYNSRKKDWNNNKTGTDTPCWNMTFKVMPQVHYKKEKPDKPAWQTPGEKGEKTSVSNSSYTPTGDGKRKNTIKARKEIRK